MCYGSPAVTGSLTHCETGNSAALFNNQPPRLQPLNRCMFPFLQDQKTKLLICLRRRGDDRSRAQNSQCGCQPDHPWRRRWKEVSLVFIAVPDCAEQTAAPRRPRHVLPDGAPLSAEGTEVLCSQISCVYPATFSAQSKEINDHNELYLCGVSYKQWMQIRVLESEVRVGKDNWKIWLNGRITRRRLRL